MIYYRVKKEFTSFSVNSKNKFRQYTFVENELKTWKELLKIAKNQDNDSELRKSFLERFDEIEVSKNKTFWFFGARFFEDGKIPNHPAKA